MSARSSARLNSPNSSTRPRSSPSACRAAAAIRRAASRSDGPELRMIRRRSDPRASPAMSVANDGSGHRRNGFPALTCATISSCPGTTPASCRRRSMRAAASASGVISTASNAGWGPPPGQPSTASSRSHWFTTEWRRRSALGRATERVYIHVRPWTTYPIRCRAPVASASQALRGPPCRSMTRSYRARRSRRASLMSHRILAIPGGRGATSTSSRCGFP